ncbi:MAG: metallophosphoesterase family protein [Thermodesulfobacteriota bacterium]
MTGRLLCVGDVHGCAPELERLLAAVAAGPDDLLVFLGDYVDRGPASRETVQLLSELQQELPATVFLRGNHEEMFLDFLGLGGANKEAFYTNGGAQTLASYGLTGLASEPACAAARAKMPASHLAFLSGLELHRAAEGFAFVHAGVRPGVPLEQQRREDLLWIREEFLLLDHRLDCTVVFGHTPYRDVWFGAGRKIGLDTGCVYGGKLSCLDLTQGILHQVTRGARSATERSVAAELDRVR